MAARSKASNPAAWADFGGLLDVLGPRITLELMGEVAVNMAAIHKPDVDAAQLMRRANERRTQHREQQFGKYVIAVLKSNGEALSAFKTAAFKVIDRATDRALDKTVAHLGEGGEKYRAHITHYREQAEARVAQFGY